MVRQKIWSGDDGLTDYLGKGRLEKSSLRVDCIGSLDESSAALGLAKSFCNDSAAISLIEKCQYALYRLMTEAASSLESRDKFPGVSMDQVAWIEAEVHRLEQEVEIPKDFILPGATQCSAALDVARTVIRRAERRLVELAASGAFQNPEGMKFINRLSTLIFYLEIRDIRSSSSHPRPVLVKDKE